MSVSEEWMRVCKKTYVRRDDQESSRKLTSEVCEREV